MLLAKGADINAKWTKDDRFAGWTPLHGMALFGATEVAEVLLAHGADINNVSDNGYTALDSAHDRDQNNDAMIQFLSLRGAKRAASLPPSLDRMAAKMRLLVLEAYPWYELRYMAQQRPVTSCPVYEDIRELGEKIHELGGDQAMRQIASVVVAQTESKAPFSASLLNKLWDGIGGWRS